MRSGLLLFCQSQISISNTICTNHPGFKLWLEFLNFLIELELRKQQTATDNWVVRSSSVLKLSALSWLAVNLLIECCSQSSGYDTPNLLRNTYAQILGNFGIELWMKKQIKLTSLTRLFTLTCWIIVYTVVWDALKS